MESHALQLECEEWWQVASDYPAEMEVITTMIVDAEEEVCEEAAG